MPLTLTDDDRGIIEKAEKAIILGIITSDDRVRLIASDPSDYPGHLEWLAHEPVLDAIRGFSLLVCKGQVSAIFVRSRLNPAPDARLEAETVEELKALLPVTDDFQMLE